MSPVDDAIDAFQSFVKRSESTFIFDEMDEDDKWAKLKKTDTYVDALTSLSKSIAVHATTHIPALYTQFEAVMKRVYELQRIAACCFYAELINQQYVAVC